MKKVIKNFPLTFYLVLSFFFLLAFAKSNPNMVSGEITTLFWNIILVVFFPIAIAVKNGTVVKLVIYVILIDLLILFFRKKLIPLIKAKLKTRPETKLKK